MTIPADGNVKLKIEELSCAINGVQVLDKVSIDVYDNEILAIIGSRNAGKTSLLNCISGFSRSQSGEIYFEGKKITGVRPDKAAQLGLARTFQKTGLLSGLSTLDNLMAARHLLIDENFLTGALYFGPAHGEELDHRRAVEDIIDFLELQAIRNTIAGTLPVAQRKKVELGRALATEPSVLLLDGLMDGVDPKEKADLGHLVTDFFKGQGNTYPRSPALCDGIKCIVLFERDLNDIITIADRAVALDSGKIIAEGKPADLKTNPLVIAAYMEKGK